MCVFYVCLSVSVCVGVPETSGAESIPNAEDLEFKDDGDPELVTSDDSKEPREHDPSGDGQGSSEPVRFSIATPVAVRVSESRVMIDENDDQATPVDDHGMT